MHRNVTPARLIVLAALSAGCSRGDPGSAPAGTTDEGDPSEAGDAGELGDGTAAASSDDGGDADATGMGSDGTSTGTADDSGGDDPPGGHVVSATVRNFVVADVTQGWSSTRYVPSIGRFVAIFVNHYSPGGYQDNSLRAFDPATDTVEYLHPRDVPGTPQDRDNHLMMFNPTVDRIWISSWNILDVALAYDNKDIPESYGAVAWSGEMDNAAFAAAADISGWPDGFTRWNSAVAWHAELDVGVIWGGSDYPGAGYTSDLYLLQPRLGGGYTFVDAGNFDAIVPPGYVGTADGRHNGVVLGDHFYAITLDEGVDVSPVDGGFEVTVRMWRYALSEPVGGAELEPMATLIYVVPDDGARYGMFFPCVTADTANNLVLVYLATAPGNNLFAYLPDHDEWVAVQTDTAAGYRDLAGCDYSPDHGLHAYWDGNNDRPPEQQGWGTIALVRDR